MKITIIATDQNGLNTENHLISYMVNAGRLPQKREVKNAIRKAVKEYCRTEEGKGVYAENCNSFNWGDLVTYVPSDILVKHGLYPVEDTPDLVLEMDFNEQLIEEGEVFPKDNATPDVKYAVSVYGIRQDTYREEDGSTGTAGLTFGPASGADFTEDYVSASHGGADHSGFTPSGNPHRCLHDDDWATIIEWSRKDPYVYEKCMGDENHLSCTKTVPLMLSQKLREEAYPDMPGDGASVLFHSIHPEYREWNYKNSNAGGWPASRIRATLNGRSADTDESVAGADCLTADKSLFAAFPEELKNAIVAKAVASDTLYYDVADHNTTTYDRLWLLSGKEYWDSNMDNDCVIRKNEGSPYQRQIRLEITTSDYQKASLYSESGSTGGAWLRSASWSSAYYAYDVYDAGDWSLTDVYNTSDGFAPGFCIR